ncbi:MAG: methionine adenosyltransferase [Alphaproteobacteria bacterium 41-28]|nr:MAG: methionine adenosyltransferase [Alphaproteobacteria bacterium 41-28]
MNKFIFTSESVSEGHPDKICDQISDAILDAYLVKDPHARTAIEAVVAPSRVLVFGEVSDLSLLARKQIEEVVRTRIRDIGYEDSSFDWRTVNIEVSLNAQSSDIIQGLAEGAGDQGMMFGYATRENEVLMPAALYFANTLLHLLAIDRKKGLLPELRPDGKCQFSVKYVDHHPMGITSIVVSLQHKDGLNSEDVKALILPYVKKVLPEGWFCREESFFVNPTGRFVIGGPESDIGFTGRKIIVDTYGGMAPHGGGAFSGKDPTKVDRSAAYMARYIAKNIVAAGLADRCTLQLSYAIGRSDPTSFYISTHGTGLIPDDRLSNTIRDLVDFTPGGIREKLNLNRPIYTRTAAYGHFGREVDPDGGFSWEKLDLVEELKGAFL